jgi:hypothetical protein
MWICNVCCFIVVRTVGGTSRACMRKTELPVLSLTSFGVETQAWSHSLRFPDAVTYSGRLVRKRYFTCRLHKTNSLLLDSTQNQLFPATLCYTGSLTTTQSILTNTHKTSAQTHLPHVCVRRTDTRPNVWMSFRKYILFHLNSGSLGYDSARHNTRTTNNIFTAVKTQKISSRHLTHAILRNPESQKNNENCKHFALLNISNLSRPSYRRPKNV